MIVEDDSEHTGGSMLNMALVGGIIGFGLGMI
jgi:hypothetical protein